MEKHSVARLIGAPPGYVGYDEGGYLTEAVRRKPYSVLLLDEVEKAHPDVFNVLLQVLDDGRLTDGQGRTVDFKNTVIVMTSNIGSHRSCRWSGRAGDDQGRGLGRAQEALPAGVPEPDRRDRRVPRARREEHRVDRRDPAQGAGGAAGEDGHEARRLAARRWPSWPRSGFDPVFGARPLKRAIQREIENPLSKLILEGRFGPKDVIPVDYDDGTLRLRARRPLTRRPPAGRGRPARRALGQRRGRGCPVPSDGWLGSSNSASSRMICSRASVRLALVLSSTACIARPGFFGTPRSSRWCEPSVIAASGRAWPKPSARLTLIIAVEELAAVGGERLGAGVGAGMGDRMAALGLEHAAADDAVQLAHLADVALDHRRRRRRGVAGGRDRRHRPHRQRDRRLILHRQRVARGNAARSPVPSAPCAAGTPPA